MDFSKALEQCKNGNLIARHGWNGKGQFVQYMSVDPPFQEGSLKVDYPLLQPFLSIKGTEGNLNVWTPSTTDLLANDWYVTL